ncbi:amidohydrolase family protein [Pseudonocardia sp. CA-107938]|uniref:amidohydrolase family protein n=1 Tax=Pseudonocardia sp. CA-107938 TaxID=3240021 RepID=UPI003D8CFBB3
MGRFAVRAARVFDGEQVLDGPVAVLVEDGRTVGVDPRGSVPDGWPVTDLPTATILPGLIDCHVHLCADAGPGALERLAESGREQLDATVVASLRQHLAAGVTTVRDLGDQDGAVLSWRRDGGGAGLPAVFASGPPITSVGGHCWSMGGQASGEAELRAHVRKRAELGADVVKIMASGGVLTPGTDTTRPQFTEDELRAVVAEARAHGLPTTAHAHALSAVEQAIRAGVDGIEHCTCLTATGVQISDDLLAALAQAGTVVCPTLGSDPAVVVPPEIIAIAARAGVTEESLRRVAGLVHGAGVAFVAGSDGGIGPAKPHGLLPLTLAEYVTAGMPSRAALTAATSAAADALGATTKGRIRPGHDADLLVVDGDPIADIAALQRPLAVYLAGQPSAIMG